MLKKLSWICEDLTIFMLFIQNGCSSWLESNQFTHYRELDKLTLYLDGACKCVPNMYKIGEIVKGDGAHGYEGDFSCYSDVYTDFGVRISPFLGGGRAFYDFGPINLDSIKISIRWVDNAWLNAEKGISIYNWEKLQWEDLFYWEGHDGLEHSDEFNIYLNDSRISKGGRVRVGIYSSWISVIHLKTIRIY